MSKTKADLVHEDVIRQYPMYEETAHWTAVLVRRDQRGHFIEWANDRGLKRGDATARNDYLIPALDLMLFKDLSVGIEVKLRFG